MGKVLRMLTNGWWRWMSSWNSVQSSRICFTNCKKICKQFALLRTLNNLSFSACEPRTSDPNISVPHECVIMCALTCCILRSEAIVIRAKKMQPLLREKRGVVSSPCRLLENVNVFSQFMHMKKCMFSKISFVEAEVGMSFPRNRSKLEVWKTWTNISLTISWTQSISIVD